MAKSAKLAGQKKPYRRKRGAAAIDPDYTGNPTQPREMARAANIHRDVPRLGGRTPPKAAVRRGKRSARGGAS